MSVIHTIGYEGADIDGLLATLKAAGVTRLVDVRAVAASRKKGFSKRALAERLAGAGVEYCHLVALGDPKPGREAARAGHHALFQRIYGAHLATPAAQDALDEATALVRERRACLLCFERAPETCHRAIVATALADRTGLAVSDLFVEPRETHVRHPAERHRHRPREGATPA